MSEKTRDQLQILSRLATEYQKKSRELDELSNELGPSKTRFHLKMLGERTLDRFRSAQQSLFHALATSSEDRRSDASDAAMNLCRCFDEMQLLFQKLMEITLEADESVPQ